ncbi:cytochrome c oxidase subunit 7B [Tachypleus tridentatus]|uniref:cytochrome c oxidase subunit 7B n=1 Tax=Tachypleus tridentatus TaxID=6853 RepID=UPI003FD4BC6D
MQSVFVLRSILPSAIRQCKRGMAGHAPVHFKPPSMNELPVPSVSWQELYNKKQSKYNIQLLLGTAFFIASVAYAVISGDIDLNLAPPMKN